MTTWFCIPSARPAVEAQACFDLWKSHGYRTAAWRDSGAEPINVDLLLVGDYEGYARTVNALVAEVLERDTDAQWFVCAGDDTEPDPNHTADEIAAECSDYFGTCDLPNTEPSPAWVYPTFGVMQPTGDGHGIESICGSPWMGREWCERINCGRGPLWPDYTHNFCDNELQEVSKRLGVLWQRPDLTHKHNNWMWTTKVRPRFLDAAYSQPEWEKAKAIFYRRRAEGFPGHEPLATLEFKPHEVYTQA